MTPELYHNYQRALHVRCVDGRLLQGGQACLYILASLGYRRTATLLGRWPLRWVVEGVYYLVARHRSFLSRFLGIRT